MQSPLLCVFGQGPVTLGACLATGFASVRLARYAAFGAGCGVGCISVADCLFLGRGYSSRRWCLLVLRWGVEQRTIRSALFPATLLPRGPFQSMYASEVAFFSLSRRARRLLRKHSLAQPFVDVHAKIPDAAGRGRLTGRAVPLYHSKDLEDLVPPSNRGLELGLVEVLQHRARDMSASAVVGQPVEALFCRRRWYCATTECQC
jgi:hypothetical protein